MGNIRPQQSMGYPFHNRPVTACTDIPRRTDIDAPVPYRQNKHVLFGQQEGRCNGCRSEFPFRNFTVDHIVPDSRGGYRSHREPATAMRALQQRQWRPTAGILGGQAAGTGDRGVTISALWIQPDSSRPSSSSMTGPD